MDELVLLAFRLEHIYPKAQAMVEDPNASQQGSCLYRGMMMTLNHGYEPSSGEAGSRADPCQASLVGSTSFVT